METNIAGGAFTCRHGVPFTQTSMLRNQWNDNKTVKIGRDGQVRRHT